jgi:NAD dependent epimerase/dehydratase
VTALAGKKILVTGADGFIGSHLVERLVADGALVRAFCIYNSQGSWGWLDTASAEVRGAIDVRLGDIRDAALVAEATAGVDVVMHLAALIAIPYSYRAPESFVATNVHGTLNVLEAARRHSVARVIVTSTSEVYGTPEALPIRETHALNAQSPYAATKVAADQLALAFHRSFGVPVVILRPFNTYGPRQSMRAVLPTILAQLLRGATTIKLGRLDTRRDLTFVTDTVDGFVRAAAIDGASIDGATIQLGTGESPSIRELFEAACRALGKQATVELDAARLRPDASEVLVLVSDPARARELIGWRPTVALEDGLRRTAEWMGQHLHLLRGESFHV